MTETSYEHISIDQCPSCKGVWLDAGELEKIKEKIEEEIEDSGSSGFVNGMIVGGLLF
jgi:Zn-finger nucleic acid-binding protein